MAFRADLNVQDTNETYDASLKECRQNAKRFFSMITILLRFLSITHYKYTCGNVGKTARLRLVCRK